MITFAIESAAGRVDLHTLGRRGVMFQPGVTGLGLPPDLFDWRDHPAGGGSARFHRVGMRDADWPLVLIADTPAELLALTRLLAAVIDPAAAPRLTATYDTGERYSLGFLRVGGGEDPVARFGETHLRWVLSVRCPNPWWISDQPVQIGPFGPSGESRGLLPKLSRLQVKRSAVLGNVRVTNPGDVASPVTWVISGPGGPTQIAVGGRAFTLDTVLVEGEVVTVARDDLGWTVTDQSGANRYADLGWAPKFSAIPVGRSSASIQMASAGGGASVTGFFRVMRKLVV